MKRFFKMLKAQLTRRPQVHYLAVIALLSAFFTLVSNAAFWRHVHTLVTNGAHEWPVLFLASVPLALFFLMFVILMILCSYKWLIKPVGCLLLISCAAATYATCSYGIIFDGNMITNIVETNPGEAAAYLSPVSIGVFIILGVLPSILLVRAKIYYPSFIKSWLERCGAATLSLGLAALCIFPFYQQYSFIGRDNKNMNREILPASYIYSASNYVFNKYFAKETPYVALGHGAVKEPNAKPRVLFLVLGETARAASYSAYGYDRPTNQFTDMEHLIAFQDMTSCGTATAYSVPCMFSNLTRETYKPKLAENREGILDVLQKAGYNVVWLDNDDGCKGVCDRVKSVQIAPVDKAHCDGTFCQDMVFLDYAKTLTENITQDTVIAFHFIGSHGPRYYERFPEKFAIFKPYCNRPDVENCSLEEVRNAYDNSIAYTDMVLYRLINDVLEQHLDKIDPMLLYVSDHGESLGENGIFLHAAPYDIAPKEQTHVPMQLWLPQVTAQALEVDKECLTRKASVGGFSHDNMFHTIMGLLEVKSSEYDPKLDVLASCETAG